MPTREPTSAVAYHYAMNANDIMTDGFDRIRDVVHATLDELDPDALTWRPDPQANTIAWLLWHLTRIADDHVADLAGRQQVWESDDWAPRFGLPAGTMDHGYGHSPEQVSAVQPSALADLRTYHDHTHTRARQYVASLDTDDYDRVIDESWDPPVTVGTRLVSVLADGLQHVGQAAYVRGLWERR